MVKPSPSAGPASTSSSSAAVDVAKKTEWLLLYILCIAYMGITFGRVSLGIASSQMREVQFLKDGSSLDFGTMQGAATTAYCVGKIFWSLVADRLGGFNNLKLTMGCTVIGGIMCGFSRSDYYFVVFWCIQMFFSSGVWGGTCIVIEITTMRVNMGGVSERLVSSLASELHWERCVLHQSSVWRRGRHCF